MVSKISLLILLISLLSCKEEPIKFATVCDVTVIKYENNVLQSVNQRKVQHYSEFTADELSKLLTGVTTVNLTTTVVNTVCKPF